MKRSEDDSNENRHLKKLFETDGYIIQRQCIPAQLLDEWKECSQNVIAKIFQRLYEIGDAPFPAPSQTSSCGGDDEYAMKHGVKHGYREIVMRSPGRYEISLLQASETLGIELPSLDLLKETYLAFVPHLLDATTWDEVQLCHLSLVMSTPGSPEQGWHADGGHVSVHEHLPCHCFNIFIPLTDVTTDKGPTEVRPATHFITRNLAPMMLAAKARKTLQSPIVPVLSVGDILLFDYRLLHRGKANVSDTDRRILVLTVAKPWFKDVLNFPSRSLGADVLEE